MVLFQLPPSTDNLLLPNELIDENVSFYCIPRDTGTEFLYAVNRIVFSSEVTRAWLVLRNMGSPSADGVCNVFIEIPARDSFTFSSPGLLSGIGLYTKIYLAIIAPETVVPTVEYTPLPENRKEVPIYETIYLDPFTEDCGDSCVVYWKGMLQYLSRSNHHATPIGCLRISLGDYYF